MGWDVKLLVFKTILVLGERPYISTAKDAPMCLELYLLGYMMMSCFFFPSVYILIMEYYKIFVIIDCTVKYI